MSNKEEYDRQYKKCVAIIKRTMQQKKYEKTIAAISLAARLQYEWNQNYTDVFLENVLYDLSDKLQSNVKEGWIAKQNVVVFYDAFGYDTRGLAMIYLKALGRLGYRIVYITCDSVKGKQPEIDKIVNKYNILRVFFNNDKLYTEILKDLQKIIKQYCPTMAFLYTLPYDSVGTILFMQMQNVVTRYQINLTDHAFWLGLNAFDYILEFRNYGASVSYNYRGVKRDKIILLPYYPYIDETIEFKGFPFGIKGKQIIFSGGSLYKTIDKNNTYYKLVYEILNRNKDVCFLYAGEGDDTRLRELQKIYADRVYHIHERKDLYQIMLRISIYLNTYPMIGGLMTQYAAIAGKIPLMLKHNNDGDGVLIRQKERGIEYNSDKELIEDVCKLLRNEEYIQKRESMLKGSVIEEKQFEGQLHKIILEHSSDYEIIIDQVDTSEFRKDYIDRFDIIKYKDNVASIKNRSLFWNYINEYIYKFFFGKQKNVLGRIVKLVIRN